MGTDAVDSLHVGVVGGVRMPSNVTNFLRNLQRLLRDHPTRFEFDLLTRVGQSDVPGGFTVVDPGIDQTDRALGTVQTLTGAVTEYAVDAEPDVLFQVTKFPVHGFATTVAGRRTGTPVVARFAGDNFREYRLSSGFAETARTYALNNVLGRVPSKFADAVVVLGPNGDHEISKRRRRSNVHRIPQPIDLSRFHPVNRSTKADVRRRLDLPVSDRIVLSVGRLSHRKGMGDIERVAQILSSRGVNFTWLVLGDGPLREQLSTVSCVETIGRVPHTEIPAYYQAADVLVHPSCIEGLPNVLVEAAACGLPTVARDVGESKLVATQVFSEIDELVDHLLSEFPPTDLGDRFDPDTLRDRYADVLLRTSGQTTKSS